MDEEPNGDLQRKSQLLYQSSSSPQFAVYIHEAEPSCRPGHPAVVLQVCLAPNSAVSAGSAEVSCSQAAAATATGAPEEVLFADGYVLRRRSFDLFLELPSVESAVCSARRSSSADLERMTGCWYGCEEDDDDEDEDGGQPQEEPIHCEASTPFRPPPREFADPGWNVIRLASWAWMGCDLEERGGQEAEVKEKHEAVQDRGGQEAEHKERDEEEQEMMQGSLVRVIEDFESDSCPCTLLAAGQEGIVVEVRSNHAGVQFDRIESSLAWVKKQNFDKLKVMKVNVSAPDIENAEEDCDEGYGAWYMAVPSRASEPLRCGSAAADQSRTAAGGAASTPAPRSSLAVPGQTELVHLSSAKVEWRIWGISAKIKHYAKGSRVFSPEFDAFGVSSLGLVFYPNGNSNAKKGFCSLGLKAPHGTHLRYKLYIGGTERFTDLRHNVTESWGFVDMCKVEDELQQEQDLLALGVEIIDDIDAHESLKTIGSSSSKVEWCIGNMQNKLRHYRKDVALYSDEFSVCGVDRLRLKFYPSGKKEADLGFCSLYLEAPKGSELRCRLSVGKKSMSFDRLEKFGEDSIWGFLTLCKLQDELDHSAELVRIGLEVLETKKLDGRLSEAEDAYLKTLGADRRTMLLGELDRVEKLRSSSDGNVPMRFRILALDISDSAKAVALSKLDTMNSDMLSGENSKLKKWIDGLLNIPFGRIRKPLVSLEEGRAKVQEYLAKARASLDKAVFGHDEPKQKIVQLLCQWIANPQSMSLVLGIQGPPGNGKTTLCRRGIAEALQRPFVQISLGGATDASVLEGHSYTYVGSAWGRIAGLIMEAQCMNPVIFFDELDKVSDTPRGEEIVGVLTHLTDHSQNRTFADRYFEGIPLDLSRALFIFSFNDESRLNHVLKDRLTVIHTEGFDQTAKLKIAREYLLPELLTNVGMQQGDVDIDRDELDHLCKRCAVLAEEGGVRGIKRSLESIVLHVNQLRMTQDDDEEKADMGVEKAVGNDTLHKATSMSRVSEDIAISAEEQAKKQDDHNPKAFLRQANVTASPEASEKSRHARDATAHVKEGRGKDRKTPKVTLPVKLTKELIDQLVTENKAKRNGPAMMYI